jgi:factor associated with neutral sphingomyelinase activation
MMTVSSWFRGSNESTKDMSVKEAAKILHPKLTHFDRNLETNRSSRFSSLLLEHGEKPLQDWAAIAYSTPYLAESNSSNREHHYAASGSGHRTQYFKSGGKTAESDTICWEQSPLKKTPKGNNHSSRRKVHAISSAPLQLPSDKDAYPSAHWTKIEGRLHLCTASLVFEPADPTRSIVRCPLNKMDEAPVEHPTESGFETMGVYFVARRHVVMKSNNTIGPYQTIAIPCAFSFVFLHSSPTRFVELCQKLFVVAAAASANRPLHQTAPELDALIQPMLDRPFDAANLVHVREQALTGSLRCSILTPLQSRPGTLVLTSERIYFQEATGVLAATETRAQSWGQRDVVATARRYHGLRDSALEIYWKDESSTLLALDRRHDREQVLRALLVHHTCFTDREFVVKAAREWQNGTISNYDYILALNSAAGRSFHDLSRYPVFPWVIADYESAKLDLTKESTFRDLTKPVGALNKERLEYFQTRLKGMQDMEEAFLYGTHYSAPGYVLYFLVRSMPEHMLCLQNGKFDAPDRMFHSILQCFRCAMTNHADVKELIPEFYHDEHNVDFLINAKGLQLGAMQNGDRVDDVTLPPWAKSGRDYIKKNRRALESDICSRVLPRWLDLIFGCKSRGEGAIEADNVFHHFAYLGPTELAGMQTEQERFQAELQATEFGIVPDMLFTSEHPLKNDTFNDAFISFDIGRVSSKDESSREAWELLDVPTHETLGEVPSSKRESHDDKPEADNLSESKATLTFHHQNDAVPERHAPDPLVSSPIRNLPLRGTGEGLSHEERDDLGFSAGVPQACESSTPSRNEDSPKVQIAVDSASSEWDIKIMERKSIHGDAVSGCILYLDEHEPDLSLLVTTSLDGGLKVHTVSLNTPDLDQNDRTGFASPFTRFAYSSILSRAGQVSQTMVHQSKLTEYRMHAARDPLASLVLATDGAGGAVSFTGGHDDVVLAYGIKSACAVASVYSHRDAVTGLDLITRTPFDGESALWLENSTHILISGSWDATVKVWSTSVASGETVSIHREPLAELFDADSSIVCVSAKTQPATGGIVIAAGCTDGSFCVWNVHSDGVQVLIHSEPAKLGGGACSVVKWVSTGGNLYLLAASAAGRLSSFALVDGALRRENAVSLGIAITALLYMDDILLVGCADGGLRLIRMRSAVHFDSKPILWTALNNRTTCPSIGAISMVHTRHNNESMYFCCTGAEDGSVALFQLRKVDRRL